MFGIFDLAIVCLILTYKTKDNPDTRSHVLRVWYLSILVHVVDVPLSLPDIAVSLPTF